MITAWGTSLMGCLRPISTRVFPCARPHALGVYAIPTPWLHQDTTTIALYGAYEDEPQRPGAPRPAYGHSKDGRDDLKQVLAESWGERGWWDTPASGCA